LSPDRGVHARDSAFPRQPQQAKLSDHGVEAGTGFPFDDDIPLRDGCALAATAALRADCLGSMRRFAHIVSASAQGHYPTPSRSTLFSSLRSISSSTGMFQAKSESPVWITARHHVDPRVCHGVRIS